MSIFNKTCYVPIAADILNPGHINVINEASKHGRVVIGLLTDSAIASYKRLPYMDYSQRLEIITAIKNVDEVVPQNTWDYSLNLRSLRPEYLVHGDDWREGVQSSIRQKVIEILKEWGGELIEIPYTKNVGRSGRLLKEAILEIGTTPDVRRGYLRRLLESKKTIKGLEVHNGLTGLIVENVSIYSNATDMHEEFDFMWGSSLTDSTARGKPDTEAVDVSTRMMGLNEILEVTTKPLIYDADTGGHSEHFKFTVKTLERLGISATIIEDKTGLKKNSLFGNDVEQSQDTIENFCEKIRQGKSAQVTEEFMIIARIESLILEKGMDDAIQRAKAYLNAGADGIMIHSRSKSPSEILEFCSLYNKLENRKYLVAVPSSYNKITEKELSNHGVNLVIYANHLLRAAYPAMTKVAESILVNSRSAEADIIMLPIKDILELIPGTK